MRKEQLASRNVAALLGPMVAMTLCLSACGDSGTTPNPVPSPRTTTTIFTDTFVGIGDQIAVNFDFTVAATGDLTVIVDWSHATNNVEVFLTTPACTIDMLNARTCTFFVTDSGVTKPKQLERAGLQSGSFAKLPWTNRC